MTVSAQLVRAELELPAAGQREDGGAGLRLHSARGGGLSRVETDGSQTNRIGIFGNRGSQTRTGGGGVKSPREAWTEQGENSLAPQGTLVFHLGDQNVGGDEYGGGDEGSQSGPVVRDRLAGGGVRRADQSRSALEVGRSNKDQSDESGNESEGEGRAAGGGEGRAAGGGGWRARGEGRDGGRGGGSSR